MRVSNIGARIAIATVAASCLLASCSSPPPPTLAAQRCYRSGDHVIDECTRAIQSGQLAPKELIISYIYRGDGFIQAKDYDRAIADFNEAIQLEPTSADAYDGRGTAHFAKGEIDEAIADDDEAIRLGPKYGGAHTNRGVSWYAKGDKVRALADFDEAIRLDANDLQAHAARGYLHFDSGEFTAAISDLRPVAQKMANPHPALVLYLAQTRSSQDGTVELKANSERVKSQTWVQSVIDLYLGQSTPSSVLEAAQTTDDRCNVQFYVGEWQLIQNNRAAAIAQLRNAVAGCPKSFVVYRGAVAELARLGQPSP
jgi:lipoprotein NlpI